MADTALPPHRNSEMSVVAFDDRTRRVMELRKQIQEGTYRPDARAVAEAIMREWDLAGDMFEEVAPPVSTAAERRAAAMDRFVIASQGRESHEVCRKAI